MKLIQNNTRLLIIVAFIITMLFISKTKLFGQEQIGVYLCGVTIHAKGDPNAILMPLKLSNKGYVILNYGIVGHYKKYLTKRLSFDAIQSFQADCGLQASSGTKIGLSFDIISKEQNRLKVSLGPGFYIRESWTKFEQYTRVNDLTESKNGKWEYVFIPVVPHIEYTFTPKGKNIGFTTYCIVDPIESVYNFGAGLSFNLNHK
jgi:hypothetical protein